MELVTLTGETIRLSGMLSSPPIEEKDPRQEYIDMLIAQGYTPEEAAAFVDGKRRHPKEGI